MQYCMTNTSSYLVASQISEDQITFDLQKGDAYLPVISLGQPCTPDFDSAEAWLQGVFSRIGQCLLSTDCKQRFRYWWVLTDEAATELTWINPWICVYRFSSRWMKELLENSNSTLMNWKRIEKAACACRSQLEWLILIAISIFSRTDLIKLSAGICSSSPPRTTTLDSALILLCLDTWQIGFGVPSSWDRAWRSSALFLDCQYWCCEEGVHKQRSNEGLRSPLKSWRSVAHAAITNLTEIFASREPRVNLW